MEFVFFFFSVVQIKLTSTGELTRSEFLVLAFLRSKARQGRVKTTYSEIRKCLNISCTTTYEAVRALTRAGLIFRPKMTVNG